MTWLQRQLDGGLESEPADMNVPDIIAFRKAFEDCFKVFLSRRKEYGLHTNRHPRYHLSGLHIKMDRAIKDIEAGHEIKKDTLDDLVCFALMLKSLMV